MSVYRRKDLPAIDTLLKRVAPKNRKHNVLIMVSTSVTPHDTCWDGGSRYSYHACQLDGREVKSVPAPTSPPQFGGGEAQPFKIESGHCVVKLGTFRGKTAIAVVYIYPGDMIQLGLTEVETL